jgi:DNA-binding NtrC family response regulator
LEQAAEKPDLIISDVIMPEMGGLALFQALQARQFTIPMILISGHPLNEEIVQLQEAGQLATLTKPPDLNRLAQLVQQMLGAA